jgi:hypothetical protein
MSLWSHQRTSEQIDQSGCLYSVPGVISGNYQWRLRPAQLSGADNSSAGAPKPVFLAKIDRFGKWFRLCRFARP